jgi:hypothetical protein
MSIRLPGGVIIQKDGCKTIDSRCEARLDVCTCMSLGDLYMYLVCHGVCRVVVLVSLLRVLLLQVFHLLFFIRKVNSNAIAIRTYTQLEMLNCCVVHICKNNTFVHERKNL